MLIYRRTSLLESPAQTLVNTVNTVGVMGKGLALEFKSRYPAMYDAYRELCDRDAFAPGKLWLWKAVDHWVLNFPTKKHWRNPSRLEWIEAGLEKFCAEYEARGVREISFPRLGCGNGNLDWADVQPVMERYLKDLPIDVYVHDFSKSIGVPEHIEAAAKGLAAEVEARTFETFLGRLRGLLHVVGDNLSDLATNEPFQARSVDGDNIVITSDQGGWEIDAEDLRGIWLAVQGGLVTADQINQSISVSGAPLISLVAMMPEFRAVEIQRHNSVIAELAVECDPIFRRTVKAPTVNAPPEFAWH